ncbi:MAG: hypothetical protein AAFW97_12170 [Pseudomonadota bacterium]
MKRIKLHLSATFLLFVPRPKIGQFLSIPSNAYSNAIVFVATSTAGNFTDARFVEEVCIKGRRVYRRIVARNKPKIVISNAHQDWPAPSGWSTG